MRTSKFTKTISVALIVIALFVQFAEQAQAKSKKNPSGNLVLFLFCDENADGIVQATERPYDEGIYGHPFTSPLMFDKSGEITNAVPWIETPVENGIFYRAGFWKTAVKIDFVLGFSAFDEDGFDPEMDSMVVLKVGSTNRDVAVPCFAGSNG